MDIIKKTKISQPDFIEIILIVVLAVWSVSAFWLLTKAMSFTVLSSITWESLNSFFLAFLTIVVLVVAVLLADVRKEIKGLY